MSTKKNIVYNILYQFLILLAPLITAPYLARAIGASGVGAYAYTYSIAYYFMLISLLGINNYGNRKIAQAREKSRELSKTFWNIYFVQLMSSILSIILYLAIIIPISPFPTMSMLQLPFLISSVVDINWFFFGLEKFKITIARNTIVKILSLILIFVFVKTPNDLWLYTLIMSCSTLFSQIILWPALFRTIHFNRPQIREIKQHLKLSLLLFVPVIAVSIYKIMDKIMLGLMSNVSEVGFYENAEKIVHIPVVIFAALGTAMLPRLAHTIANKDNLRAKHYIEKSINAIMFMSAPMTFGLIAIATNFAPLYFGADFFKTGQLVVLLATTLPFLSFANVIRTQYLIPKEKDKIYIKSVFLGAIINLIMNLIFIPSYGSIGACFGTIAAEFIVMAYQAFAVRRELPIRQYLKQSLPFLIKSVIMFGFIYPLNLVDINPYARLVAQILAGIAIYGLLNLRYLSTFLNFKKLKFSRPPRH